MEPSDGRTEGGSVPPANANRARFLVVGIGASAGGLEALEALIGRLAPDGTAFVVLQHLAPGRVSALAEILGRRTSMQMVIIEDGQELAPSTIFIAPPAVEVSLQGGVLRLTKQAEGGLRHSIDGLLRSLAAERGPEAIGVILSGAGNDGTLGRIFEMLQRAFGARAARRCRSSRPTSTTMPWRGRARASTRSPSSSTSRRIGSRASSPSTTSRSR
jgi:two-component system CheB/CheR fusion protein